jgi:tetratricopeptide (TPR) repeat protein
MSADLQQTLAGFNRFLSAEPDHVEVLVEKAHVLSKLGRTGEALACTQRALSVDPSSTPALNMHGMILDALGRHEEALESFQQALAIQPEFADALNNRGIHFARTGQFVEALICYERSLTLIPDQPHALYNRAMARLALGDWTRGLRELESRWRVFPLEASRLQRLAPVWMGQEEIRGKTVLLHHEQGYGDTLQFSRYAPLVAALGAKVIVAVPAALRTLMQSLPGHPQIVAEGEPVPPHDYCCSLMSLPLVFGTTPDDVPAEIPYLRAEAQASSVWAGKLGEAVRPRIGLVWSGRRYPPINIPRDMTLESLMPLLTLDAEFVCLQTAVTEPEQRLLASMTNVVSHGEHLKDFADTAALIDNLDLVITVDTAVAHLTGALGKPVWVMNRYASCWRWLLKRSDSPWYPGLRLFRQKSLGAWSPVVQEVRDAAQALIRAWHLKKALGTALRDHQQGRLPQAIHSYRSALALQPMQPEALHYLGVALAQHGQYQEALTSLSHALRLQPDNAALHNHYGNCLTGLRRYEDALRSYDRAIALNDAMADAHYNRAVALIELGQPQAALEACDKAIALEPAHARAHNNRGNLLADLGKLPEALACYEQAVQRQPSLPDAWVNQANLLRRLIRYEEALARADRAIACANDHAAAHSARGAALACMGRDAEALSSYRRALELQPDLAEALWNQAIVLLSQGEYRQGWVHYEARWRVKSLALRRPCGEQRPWLGGEPLRNKTILLYAEQGYGDTLQFCRYASLVAAQGARVLLGVPSALQRLMRSLDGVDEVIAQGALPAFDYQCPLLSLPLAFSTELSTIPAPKAYLRADVAPRMKWASRLGPRSEPRVGFVWSGQATHTNDANRSVPLAQFLPLARCGAHCVSLQKEVREADEAILAQSPFIQRCGEEVTDFADTAALISELDLVITVDTSVAHLAGALGKPVWILLPYVADWRWLQDRDDSPWYPSARLFRQRAPGKWQDVIEKVGVELQAFLASSREPVPQRALA